MTRNMGTIDRGLRLLGMLSGNLAIALGVVAAVFFLTSLTGTCPAYLPFGLSTIRKR